MVIVRLIGGLANQMFPYAAGRSLAHRLNTELKLDITGFAVYRQKVNLAPRSYGLGAFSIRESFATTEEIEALKTGRQSLLNRLGKKFLKLCASARGALGSLAAQDQGLELFVALFAAILEDRHKVNSRGFTWSGWPCSPPNGSPPYRTSSMRRSTSSGIL